jgi:hypothetical protein
MPTARSHWYHETRRTSVAALLAQRRRIVVDLDIDQEVTHSA